jgi:hypothetical protein
MPPEETPRDPNPHPAQNAPATPPSGHNASVEWEFNGWGVVASVLAVLGVLFISGVVYFHLSGSTPTTLSQAASDPTETRFHNDIVGANDTSDLSAEWRSARSDHKIIAYAIARCLGITEMNAMPQSMFSMLLLDLRPNGDHWWHQIDATRPASPAVLKPLTGYEAALLAISDEVARARLAATGGATDFFPYMFWFGWASVIVSAMATALVTLKASLSANTYPKWSMFFGILAVVLSTAATVLTGAKQFWDPTNAYMRNETALLALRQLHAEVALTFIANWDAAKCQPPDGYDDTASFARWRTTLVSLESGTMKAPVIVSAQNGTATQNGTNALPRGRPTPGEAPPRPVERAAAEPK